MSSAGRYRVEWSIELSVAGGSAGGGEADGLLAVFDSVRKHVTDAAGVVIDSDALSIEAIGDAAAGADAAGPDFAALFGAGGPSGLTPRNASGLYASACYLADQAYDDIEEFGSEPVEADGQWSVFDTFPRQTWRQDAVWRRQAARAFDDLAADLGLGDAPVPRCTAEELALHLIIQDAKDDDQAESMPELPEHLDDAEWDLLEHALFHDRDVLMLYRQDKDGIEDPSSDENQNLGIGDGLLPANWFRPFDDADSRDPRRPFRR